MNAAPVGLTACDRMAQVLFTEISNLSRRDPVGFCVMLRQAQIAIPRKALALAMMAVLLPNTALETTPAEDIVNWLKAAQFTNEEIQRALPLLARTILFRRIRLERWRRGLDGWPSFNQMRGEAPDQNPA